MTQQTTYKYKVYLNITFVDPKTRNKCNYGGVVDASWTQPVTPTNIESFRGMYKMAMLNAFGCPLVLHTEVIIFPEENFEETFNTMKDLTEKLKTHFAKSNVKYC